MKIKSVHIKLISILIILTGFLLVTLSVRQPAYSADDFTMHLPLINHGYPLVAERYPNLTCIPPEPVGNPSAAGLAQAFPSLPNLSSIMAMVQPANDSSFWFLLFRDGRVYTIDNDAAEDNITQVLNISSRVSTSFEMGLTGMAVHPDYPQDNRVFLVYNDSTSGKDSTVSAFEVFTPTHVISNTSETVLFTLDQPQDNHNGGDIAFGPDGMLYASFGDGGGSSNRVNSQDLTNLLGTIARIDVSTTPYSIPADNPFNSGQAKCTDGNNPTTCPEIYAYGFRNPWRFSIDPVTGDVWVGDVGENAYEEINRLVAGGNYGWPIMEAAHCFGGGSCDQTGLSLPITEYAHSGSQAITGGYVYRGSESPGLAGKYIFGDGYDGQFYTVDADAPVGTTPDALLDAGSHFITAMAQGNDGEVYALDSAGSAGDEILRVISGGAATVDMPENLSETGCFNVGDKTHPQGIFEYSLITPLWSDGAAKDRAFALPDGTEVEVLSDGDFDFPTNAVLIKHFLNGSTYLETRLLINHPTLGWQGYSYEWNAGETEAVLLTEGKTKDVGDFVHTFPSPSDCTTCHTSAANGSLGVEVLQLNKEDAQYGWNLVDFLSTAGFFAAPVDSSVQPKLHAIENTSASLEDRARSYLHSNCSGCHRPDGPADFMDLRFSTALGDTNICGVAADDDLGVPGAERIDPGSPSTSVILLRMEALNGDRMPPLATLIEDEAATQLISDWITSLAGCD